MLAVVHFLLFRFPPVLTSASLSTLPFLSLLPIHPHPPRDFFFFFKKIVRNELLGTFSVDRTLDEPGSRGRQRPHRRR